MHRLTVPIGLVLRPEAAKAAAAIRAVLADPLKAGEATIIHIKMYRSSESGWIKTWETLPGLILDLRTRTYSHALLPKWEYTPREMKTEMIEDLERFAETGEQPKVATR